MSMTVAEAAEYYIQELLERNDISRSTQAMLSYTINNFTTQVLKINLNCTEVTFMDQSVLNIPQVINK